MRTWLIGAASLTSLLVALSPAIADPLTGVVVESEARWAYGHRAIVTESTVERSDGSRVTVHQLGGSRDGVGMRISHGHHILRGGDDVRLDVTPTRTTSGRQLYQLRDIVSLRPGPAPGDDKLETRRDFVRTANSSGADIFWASGCAFLSPSSEGSAQIAGDTEFEVIDQVLATWQSETRSCSKFELINEGPDDREVGLDGINLIKFREGLWCRPASDDDPQECYDEAAAGLTTLFFIDDSSSGRNGEIIDADIELNGVNFALAVGGQSSGTQNCQADLANTLTHEVGHFLGLDHTCWAGGPRLLDDSGNLVPECSGPGVTTEITDATMYNFQSCGETKKATLEADDIAGMCAIYPAALHPDECKPADIDPAGCCSIAGTRATPFSSRRGPTLLLLLGLMALVGLRSRLQS